MSSINSANQLSNLLSPRSRSEDRSLHIVKRMPTSTGGGRAWSEEEENYLIETRQRKMPYKHIAAYLQKTELACRLHYHQLSFGTKRRRRGSSASSARSTPNMHCFNQEYTTGLDPAFMSQRLLPTLSPPTSPSRTSGVVRSRGNSPQNNVPILPKPHPDLNSGAKFTNSEPMTPNNHALRLLTQDVCRFEREGNPFPPVNRDRLLRIYDMHRSTFWCILARDYGDNIDPLVLEDTFRRMCAAQYGVLPPTPPNCSPQAPGIMATVVSAPNSGPAAGQQVAALEPPIHRERLLPRIFAPDNSPHTGQRQSLVRGQMSKDGHDQGQIQDQAAVPPRSTFTISELLTETRDVRGSKFVMA